MNSLFNYFRIIRPLNVAISGITTYMASYLLDSSNNHLNFIMCIMVMLFCAIANIINDLFDIDTDSINNPNRPIIVENNTNFNYSLFFILLSLCLLSAILTYLYLDFYSTIFLLFIFLLIFIYTPLLKGKPLIGNITISFILASVFIFPSVVLNINILTLFFPALLTFLLTFIREVIKDIADIEGDKKSHIYTFPVVFGIYYSIILITCLAMLLIVVSIYPYIVGKYSFSYVLVLVLYVQIPLVSCIFYLWKYPNSHFCETLTITTKYITIGGVITILSTKMLI